MGRMEQVKVVAASGAVSTVQAKYRIAGGSGSVLLGLSVRIPRIEQLTSNIIVPECSC